MEDRHRQRGLAGLVQEIRLNRNLSDAIIAECGSRRCLSGGHFHAGAVYPDGAAVQKVPDTSAQAVHQLLCAFQVVAGEVDDHLRIQLRNALTKSSSGLLLRTIDLDSLDQSPRGVLLIRLLKAAADADNRMTCVEEPRCQKAADMAGSTNDRYTHVNGRQSTIEAQFTGYTDEKILKAEGNAGHGTECCHRHCLPGVLLFFMAAMNYYWPAEERRAHNDLIGWQLSVLGTTYAVIVGFMLYTVWIDFGSAELNADAEANSLVNLYRLADGLAPQQGAKSQGFDTGVWRRGCRP